MSRVRMLIYFGVTPYLVFDGDNLPSKSGTESDRAKRRAESKRLGLELYKAGKVSQAHQELQKAADVTPHMARQLIEELKRKNIQYIVAPYEADAQLAYLERKGIINGILSEDSDLLVFGAKRLLTKLDQHGDCIEIDRTNFALCREVNLAGWTDTDFRRMAILSGCDYLPSISKMGLKTAYRYIRKYRNPEKLIRMLQLEGHFCVPLDYLERFKQAELTFLHHRVFCPTAEKLVFLTDLEHGTKESDMPYLGEQVEAEVAIGVASGDLHPTTKTPILVQSTGIRARSASAAHRNQTVASAADLKSNRSLDSFFKPMRQPLAELDPNSLTPSPSQQRLLERHANASWEPRLVASAPQLRTETQLPEPTTTGRSAVTNADRASFLSRASAMSTYQPPKRQRLCSEQEENQTNTGVSKSRFFENLVEATSPSTRKKKSKMVKKSTFDIYSDDSVDDILLGLPDVDFEGPQETTRAIESKKCGDFQAAGAQEIVPETSPDQPPQGDSRSDQGREFSNCGVVKEPEPSVLQNAIGTLTSVYNDIEAFEGPLELEVKHQNEGLRKTFSAQTAARRVMALESLGTLDRVTTLEAPTKSSFSAGESNIEASQDTLRAEKEFTPKPISLVRTFSYLAQENQVSALRSLARGQGQDEKVQLGREAPAAASAERQAMTPLERLGRKACQGRKSIPSSGRTVVDTRLRECIISHVVVQPSNLDTIQSKAEVGGSEDLIVPNSEDEGDQLSEEEKPVCSLTFGRFAFTPL